MFTPGFAMLRETPDKKPLAEVAFEIGPPLPLERTLLSSSIFSSAAAPRFVEIGSP